MNRIIKGCLLVLCLALQLRASGLESFVSSGPEQLSEKRQIEANTWLNSLNEYLDGRSNLEAETYKPFESIISEIPSPDVWPYIIKNIEKEVAELPANREFRKAYLLKILVAILKEDTQSTILLTQNYLEALKNSEKGGYHDYVIKEFESDLYKIYLASGNPALIKKALDAQLERIRETGFTDKFMKFLLDIYLRLFYDGLSYDNDEMAIDLPEIITLFGEEEAKKWVRNALSHEGVKLTSESSVVKSFLRQQVMEMGEAVSDPQWQLVSTVSKESIDLYESINKRFPYSNSHEAEAYYIFSLVVDGKIDKAYERIKGGFDISSADEEVYSFLIKAGKAREAYGLLKKYIDEYPNAELMGPFIRVGVAAGEKDKVIDKLDFLRSAPGFSKGGQLLLDFNYIKARYAAGVGGDRAKLLHDLAGEINNVNEIPKEFHHDLYDLAIDLMRAGGLFNDKPLYHEAKQLALMFLNEYGKRENSGAKDSYIGSEYYSNGIHEMDFIDQLCRNDELVEAKERLISLAKRQADESSSMIVYRRNLFAAELLQVYVLLGDYESGLELLDQYPDWDGKVDVADLVSVQLENDEYLGYAIAEIFKHTGKRDQAEKVIRKLMYEKPGYDPAYREYLSMVSPGKAISEFEKLYRLDAFEERPLIWAAQIYLDLKEYDKAMEYLEKAVSIDPSDGEQGKGRRMRVYELMGKVHLSRGNKEKARFFENIVTSIRISERADEFYDSGFTKKSLDMYEEALSYFSDAYCIQSRLAVRQSSFGMESSALEHYQRAYELMPDSFGRMETHCLACSAIFDREDAQATAEKIFGQLMVSHPSKPQTWYMMGYLKKIQKDFTSAKVFFRKAASIDPDYINAWKQMKNIEDDIVYSPEEYDDIAINIMRLDPMSRHTYFGEHHVQKVSRLWTDLEESRVLVFPEFENIYSLKSAKARLDASSEERKVYSGLVGEKERVLKPGELLSRHQIISMLSYLY